MSCKSLPHKMIFYRKEGTFRQKINLNIFALFRCIEPTI